MQRRVESGRLFLEVTDDELEELTEYLAAEANHEPNRRRQKRLDAALELLTDAQEDERLSRVQALSDENRRDYAHQSPMTLVQ